MGKSTMMTTNLSRLLAAVVLIGTAWGAQPALAQFTGGDNFNDNVKDTTRWGTDTFTGGSAVLTETNGRLEYTTPSTPTVNNFVRPWILNQGVYDRNWYVQMDAAIGFSSPPNGTFVGGNISLSVVNAADGNDATALQLSDFNGTRVIQIVVFRDGLTEAFQTVATTSPLVTLRIAFDAGSQTLDFLWDSDGPVGGLVLTSLLSVPIGSGGADWDMDASSLFNARIFGASGEFAIASGQLYADNFVAATDPIPEPGTLALLGAGLLGIGLARRRRPSAA
jgi:hypothetical protein